MSRKKPSYLTIDRSPVKKDNVIGYCWNATHYGYITTSLIRTHECIKKRCPYLEKYEDSIFWKKKTDSKELRKKNKIEKRNQYREEVKETLQKQDYVKNSSIRFNMTTEEVSEYFMRRYFDINKDSYISLYFDPKICAIHLLENIHREMLLRKKKLNE